VRPVRRARRRLLSVIGSLLIVAGLLPATAVPALAAGSVSLTAIGTAYSQDFDGLDGLASTGTSSAVPNGWAFSESGANANATYTAGTGSGNAGDTYSFGPTPPPVDRAFGGLLSGSLTPTIGASFSNDTTATITSVLISYTGEEWRIGTLGRGADRIDFQISANATSLTTGTWTDHDALDFSTPNLTGAAVGGRDGNAAANRTSLVSTVTGLAIAPGGTFWIRWTDFNASGADDGLAVDGFSLTPFDADGAPAVATTVPANGAANVDPTTNITITFSEPVDVTGSWYSISCATSAAHIAAVSGGPTTFTLDPDVDFATNEACTVTVVATQVADQDVNDPPNTMEGDYAWSFTTRAGCGDPSTEISAIQGSGPNAAITGNVTVEGIVVGDYETATGLQYFYLQDATGDGDAETSDGIAVFTGSADTVSTGEKVRVSGFARERSGQTTINGSNSNSSAVPPENIQSCGSGSVSPVDVTLPFANGDYPERYEGMLVRLPQALVISEYFNYERFGELVLAQPLPGETRPFTPTAIDEPGAPAQARAQANLLSRITLDDGLGIQNPASVRHPNGAAFSLTNRFRGGDTVQNTAGVLGFEFGLYRIQPTGPATYSTDNPRPAAPEPVGGNLRAAAMNTLNFFLTQDYPTGNPLDNKCGPAQNVECRGADADQPTEFDRQRDKLLAAIAGLNGDVVGLNELENTTGVDPLGDPARGIVPGLNARLGAGTYAYINTGTIGTDAIRVGLIYKPSKVVPVGGFQVLDSSDDPRFIDTKSRPVLAQTFEQLANGERFTVAVNHLKSKGSDCEDVGDPDTGDQQGNCNLTRKAAAQALVDWLATDPTGSGDPDFLITGDLNSYAKEDPIDAIKAGPDDVPGTADDYTNLIAAFQGTYAHSYVFDGQAGYLDYALASPSLIGRVLGAADWHINSDEPDILDYDTSFKPPAQDALYEPNAYRSSDHDPVVVGLDLGRCLFSDNATTRTRTLLGDCSTSATILVPDGWTLDGAGHTIAAYDPEGDHFRGAVVANRGAVANVRNVTVTTYHLADVCDGGVDRLRGILLDGASGSITNNGVIGINQGRSGCQEGNAIETRNAPFDTTGTDLAVTITGNQISDYQKTGIIANGSVFATIRDNQIAGWGPTGVIAQNGIQIGFGGSAFIRGNSVSGNFYTGPDVACGLLFFEAEGVKQQANTLFANERDVCNFGKGGGNVKPGK
jgi:uncharacterized protein